MKICLILPCMGKVENKSTYVRSWQMQPLVIAVLSAITPDEHDIVFYDDRFDEIPDEIDADLVAMPIETYTALRAYQIAYDIRKQGKQVVMGGMHVNLIPEEVQCHSDAIILGDAEPVWDTVLRDASARRLQPIYDGRGKGKTFQQCLPDRTIFGARPYLPLDMVEAGRGCPFTCDFCAITAANNRQYRIREIDTIIEDIQQLDNRFLYFVDDNFVSKFSRTKELCDAMIPLKKKWFSHGSINMAHDQKLLKRLAASGCSNILIGFESLNSETLAKMGKSWNTVKRNYTESIKRIVDHGISIYGTFVFGYDTDKPDDMKRAFDFAIEQKLALAAFNHLVPFPGTPLYDRLEKENRLLYKKWWLQPGYQFGEVSFQPLLYTPEELAEQCYFYRKEFYSLKNIMKRLFLKNAHMQSFYQMAIYLSANLTSQKGIIQRQSWPLGDQRQLQTGFLQALNNSTSELL